ncbi:MAG: hypothetical protein HON90_13540 [Halobacteriovoraceae bacterium]|nr:hypothetical protein [Halobacteriovoraceae bacterium]
MTKTMAIVTLLFITSPAFAGQGCFYGGNIWPTGTRINGEQCNPDGRLGESNAYYSDETLCDEAINLLEVASSLSGKKYQEYYNEYAYNVPLKQNNHLKQLGGNVVGAKYVVKEMCFNK